MNLSELRKCKYGLTHSGIFHADDVFATAFIELINPDIKIIRSNSVPDDFDGIVYDVGLGEFDHHGRDNEARENGIPYAAFGKLWRKFAKDVYGEYVSKKIDRCLIESLDLSDNTGKSDSLCLAIAALSAVSLSGCSSVTSNSEGYILTYTYNGKNLQISTDEIIERYLNENRNDHAAAFYNALNEVVIRLAFEKGGELASFKSTVDRNAEDDVNQEKDKADEEGTNWSDYLDGQITNEEDSVIMTHQKLKKATIQLLVNYKMNIIFYTEQMVTFKTKFLITLDIS